MKQIMLGCAVFITAISFSMEAQAIGRNTSDGDHGSKADSLDLIKGTFEFQPIKEDSQTELQDHEKKHSKIHAESMINKHKNNQKLKHVDRKRLDEKFKNLVDGMTKICKDFYEGKRSDESLTNYKGLSKDKLNSILLRKTITNICEDESIKSEDEAIKKALKNDKALEKADVKSCKRYLEFVDAVKYCRDFKKFQAKQS